MIFTLALIETIGVWLILGALGFLSGALAPKNTQARPKPGKFEIPVAEPGKAIPVVFGTVLIRDASVIWWGDLRTEPILKKGGKK